MEVSHLAKEREGGKKHADGTSKTEGKQGKSLERYYATVIDRDNSNSR